LTQLILACRWIAAAGLFLVISGCGGGAGSESNIPGPQLNLPAPSGQYRDLQFTLTTDKRIYSVGEPVLATMAVKNTGTETLYFDSGAEGNGPGLDNLIVQQGSTEAWNYDLHIGSLGGVYLNVPIAPGQTLVFGTLIWNQMSDNGQVTSPSAGWPQVPAGTYTFRTYTGDNFYGENSQPLSWYETYYAAPLATITIK